MPATYSNDLAIRPASDNAGQQLTTFSQQGSLDWVALGRMPYTASIAVLGRLAGAGIDTLTIAFGQALCSSIPLGIHGEKVLHDAMKRLSSCSTFGDLVWFGVGVRHVLRDLVQTSQGAALVALCAALGEGYAADVSALVLYEISQSLGAPGELTPSFNQWCALVRVTGSVFKDSTLGVRIGQLIKLSGLSKGRSLEVDHPVELAQVILAVGKLLRKQSETIYVHGGPACSWVAAWADFVLGLRVEVISCNGDSIFVNYAKSVMSPQVVVVFTESTKIGTEIQCTGSTMVVRSGGQFIREYLNISPEYFLQRDHWPLRFSGGRLPWDSMLRDTFGDDFVYLVSVSRAPSAAEHSDLCISQAERPARTDVRADEPGTALARFIACKSYDIVTNTAVGHLYSYLNFVSWLPDQLGELQRLKPSILTEARKLLVGEPGISMEDYMRRECENTTELLAKLCACSPFTPLGAYCAETRQLDGKDRTFCLLGISRTILYLSYLLSYLVLDTPLRPTLRGLLWIHRHCGWPDQRYHDWGQLEYLQNDLRSVDAINRGIEEGFDRQLWNYATLFGAEGTPAATGEISAFSDGSIFYYIETLREPTDEIKRAVRVHVGAGSIQQGSRMYREVSGRIRSDVERSYEVELVEETMDTALLTQDTTSQDLSCKAVVEDRAGRLAFWYRMTSRQGEATFSPTQQLYQLVKAREYLISHARLGLVAGDRNPNSTTISYAVARGEGIVCYVPFDRFVLRPLRSNTLGRCTALARSNNPVALVRSVDELARFFEVWVERKERAEAQRKERAEREQLGKKGEPTDSEGAAPDLYMPALERGPPYFELIS